VPSYCKYKCQSTADCANSGENCVLNGSLSFCNINYCSVFWAACNASATGDGTCIPVPYSTDGVCFQAGGAAVGSSCDYSYSRVDAGPLCVPGDLCLPVSNEGVCVTGCDPTLDAGTCPSGEACAALVGTPSHPTSAHLGYCAAAFSDAGSDAGGALQLPQVANNGGFGTLAVPNLVTISYQNYPYDVKSYGDWMLSSQWLATVGADYGVSNGGTHVADAVISGSAPASVTDSDIRDLLVGWVDAGGIPAPDSKTIYLVYFPDTTTITAIGGTSCQYGGFGGYHDMFIPDSGTDALIYGVIASCPNNSGFGPSEANGVSLAASHEFMEAATDPDPVAQAGSDRTWAFTDYTDPWAWNFGEVGDPCTGAPTSETTDAGTFLAQRIWSNTAAKNGSESPCIPIPANEVYFTVYTNPAATQFITHSSNDQSVTYTVVPWANGPVSGGWNIFAGSAITDSQTGMSAGSVTFSQADGGSGNQLLGVYVGAPLTMTVDVPANTSGQSLIQVQIYSYTDPTFNDYNIWPAAIIVE
jgi:hypothetical protein